MSRMHAGCLKYQPDRRRIVKFIAGKRREDRPQSDEMMKPKIFREGPSTPTEPMMAAYLVRIRTKI